LIHKIQDVGSTAGDSPTEETPFFIILPFFILIRWKFWSSFLFVILVLYLVQLGLSVGLYISVTGKLRSFQGSICPTFSVRLVYKKIDYVLLGFTRGSCFRLELGREGF
jgi:hypothetical protein